MRLVRVEELERGDLILVKWFDASELRAKLNQHEKPEVAVYEWGIYLGVRGRKRKHLLLGKEHVKGWGEWGAARIPVSLIEEVWLLMRRSYQKCFPNLVLKKKIRIKESRSRVKVNI
ncbi:hypothetical protein B6U79_03855 [Candidatus Bathyarchaeota archaeon ex4484_231]|nr:MAG: hypothetical protein B6U79_03855 [Candidatus Bathyarchaeota archaeon ex4484_231]RJS76233.1 MAG: hypothetical protein CW712_02365 [Candidatus Bathyarchaeota archaeon]